MTPSLPDKRYGCIVADPPWRYNAGQATRIKPPYPTMTFEEIAALQIWEIAADAGLLFLWTTSSFQELGYQVCRAWGFEPKSQIVWIKRRPGGPFQIGMDSYVRNAHETCLIASRGGATGLVRNLPSVIEAPRGKHSVKPDRLLEMAEFLAPEPRIELFARRSRPGWDRWGYEAP